MLFKMCVWLTCSTLEFHDTILDMGLSDIAAAHLLCVVMNMSFKICFSRVIIQSSHLIIFYTFNYF